jgi:hypothetical protein
MSQQSIRISLIVPQGDARRTQIRTRCRIRHLPFRHLEQEQAKEVLVQLLKTGTAGKTAALIEVHACRLPPMHAC